ncbi:hypothetical protein G9A89_008783 [Geosiphon pyriformis]|nr:hypothetical protein G9A89_008783 [Geosiphon pyriformis]
MAATPQNMRQLRACLLCSLVKNYEQFKRDGCDNCEEYLRMSGSAERVAECTTTNFDGMIANMRPDRSWVAKYKKIDEYVRGIYAVGILGRVPSALLEQLDEMGIDYIPRDGTNDK